MGADVTWCLIHVISVSGNNRHSTGDGSVQVDFTGELHANPVQSIDDICSIASHPVVLNTPLS